MTIKVVIAVVSLLLGAVGASLVTEGVNIVASPIKYDEWPRLLVTLILALTTAYLAVKGAYEKGYKKTIEIQTGNLAALDRDNKRLKEENINWEKKCLDWERKYDVLSVKTDLTQVIEKLDDNQKDSEERYTEAMDALTKMLDILNTQGKNNTDSITRILGIIDKRWKIEEIVNGQTPKHR